MRGLTVQDYLASEEAERERECVRHQVTEAGRKAGKSPRTISADVQVSLMSLSEIQVVEAPDQYLEARDLVRRYRDVREDVPELVTEAREIAYREIVEDLIDPEELTKAEDPLAKLEDLLGWPPVVY